MSGAEAKDVEVEEALENYVTRLKAMDDRGAADASERLLEMDCGVCEGIGKHLSALAVAIQAAPTPERTESIRREAITSAEQVSERLFE